MEKKRQDSPLPDLNKKEDVAIALVPQDKVEIKRHSTSLLNLVPVEKGEMFGRSFGFF
jgi:hypothetical protein